MERLVIMNDHKVNSYHDYHHRLLEKDCMLHFEGAKIALTKTPEEARSLVEGISDPRFIIAFGGDGTANNLLQSIMNNNGNSVLGVIPWDSGDHARALGFNKSFVDTYKTFEHEKTHSYLLPHLRAMNGDKDHLSLVDVGKFRVDDGEPRYFLNWLGTGYFAKVGHEAQGYNGKKKPYLRITRKLRREAQPIKLERLVVDQGYTKTEREGVMISSFDAFIGNYFGGGKKVNPQGDLEDGMAELLLLKTTNRIPFYGMMAEVQLNSSLHLASDNIDYVPGARRIEAEFAEEQTLQYDGETYGHDAKKVEIEILPQALMMIRNGH